MLDHYNFIFVRKSFVRSFRKIKDYSSWITGSL